VQNYFAGFMVLIQISCKKNKLPTTKTTKKSTTTARANMRLPKEELSTMETIRFNNGDNESKEKISPTDEHGWTRKHGNTEIYDYNNLNNINQQQLQSTPFAHEAHRGPRRSQQHSERSREYIFQQYQQ
jgi:hypothetical protein